METENLKQEEDDFENAFAEFAGGEEGGGQQPVDDQPGVQNQGGDGSDQNQTDRDAGISAPQDEQQLADSSGGQQKPPEDDIEKIKARMKSWEGRLSASDKRANELAMENESLKQQLAGIEANRQAREASSGRTDGEQQQLADDVYQNLVNSYGEDFARDVVSIAERKVQEALRPLQETQKKQEEAYRQNAAQSFFSEVGKEHPDFKELVLSGDVITWINEQPEYIAVGMRQVYQGGPMATVENTNNLLADYKRSRNLSQSKDNSQASHKQAARQSAQAAAAIPSRRRGAPPAAAPSEDDFDGWFNVHARKLESEAGRG